MVLEKMGQPLVLRDIPCPTPKEHEVLIKVHTCGVCRTDLHIVDQELETPKLPLILGHQVVGSVEKTGAKVSQHKVGDRVGVPWLGKTCQTCEFCQTQRENLCDNPMFTGYTQNGGYAEYCTAEENYALSLPKQYSDVEMAPMLCAGLIGYRAFRLTGKPKSIGLYGFGSSAHLLIQLAHHLKHDLYVFTRPGDTKTQEFARSLGAKWAGGSDTAPPKRLSLN